jgi:hypothetical protein
MKNFKLFLEEVKNINSDKEVRLKDYQDKINYYNSNKNKFLGILSTKKQEIWEDEANKIINGNKYLGDKWKIDKMDFTIKQDEAKIKSNELTAEEEKKIALDIANHKKELNKLKQESLREIQDDLKNLQSL